jgi:anti-anti-sigma factor
MMSKLPNAHAKDGGMTPPGVNRSASEQVLQVISIDVERSGDWMPSEEFLAAERAAAAEGADVTIDLHEVHHLDASALQVLLALDTEQKKQGRSLQLMDVSPQLRRWMEFAGVLDHFPVVERRSHE